MNSRVNKLRQIKHWNGTNVQSFSRKLSTIKYLYIDSQITTDFDRTKDYEIHIMNNFLFKQLRPGHSF